MLITELYQKYFLDIQRYLKRFLSISQAEDLAQEVFIKADKGLKSFRAESSPKTWLYQIATNTLIDYLRSKSHRNDKKLDSITDQELEQYASSISVETPMELDVIRNEMNTCIREFIQRLPESYSTVLVLGDLEGCTNKEIADILNLSIDTVKIRLHRARARLKEELSQGCEFSHNEENDLVCQRKEKIE